ITTKVFYYSDYKPGEPVRQTMTFADAFNHIKTFGVASYKIDALLVNDLGSLNAATDDNIYDALVTIKNSIPELKQAEQVIETTKFRYPKDKTDGELCKKEQCLAICPPLSLYDGALSQLEVKIDYILSKSAPFFNHKTLAASLADNTKNRFFYRESEQKSAYYKAVLAPIKPNITKIISDSEEVASHVNNGTFKSKLETLKSLDNQINYSITSHNFSNIDTSIIEYKLLAAELENLSESVFEVYERSYDAKQQTAALLFSLDSKDLNPDLSKRVLELKEATYSLDAQFNQGLTPEQYSYFEESYYGISNEVLSIIQNQKEFVALSKFRGLARKINNGFSDLIESSNIIPSAQISQFSKRLPLAFSIFSFISLTSIVLLIGLSHLSNSKNKTSLLFFSLGLVAFIGGILLFSAGLYFYLDKTSNSADVTEFIMTMNGEKNVSIVMDLQDVPFETANNIKSCASLLNESLVTSEQNRSVTVYQLDGSGCKVNNGDAGSSESCEPPLGQPTFVLKYSSDFIKPAFSAVFDKKAYISGDDSYYKYCAISSVFR
ncbi:hypothetical protein HYT84_04330, partial [Candidatus Micrarchaeota archaeon]|nr:hypothetical protein [Candidatus Micrarchaeota archaeon]